MDTIGDPDLAKKALKVIVSYLPLAHIAGMVCIYIIVDDSFLCHI